MSEIMDLKKRGGGVRFWTSFNWFMERSMSRLCEHADKASGFTNDQALCVEQFPFFAKRLCLKVVN